MQQGSLIRSARKRGPEVWQFRWADRGIVRKTHLSQAGYRNRLPIRRRGLCPQSGDGNNKRNQCECLSAMPSPDDYC
jgi:hypothetical protein